MNLGRSNPYRQAPTGYPQARLHGPEGTDRLPDGSYLHSYHDAVTTTVAQIGDGEEWTLVRWNNSNVRMEGRTYIYYDSESDFGMELCPLNWVLV